MESKQKRVEFMPPEGFKTPEGVESGHDWDMVCSFRTKPDGKICMTKLGDHEMPGYDEDYDEHDEDRESDHKPDYSRMARAIAGDMGDGSSNLGIGETPRMGGY